MRSLREILCFGCLLTLASGAFAMDFDAAPEILDDAEEMMVGDQPSPFCAARARIGEPGDVDFNPTRVTEQTNFDASKQ